MAKDPEIVVASATVHDGMFPVELKDIDIYAQVGAYIMRWSDIDSIFFNVCHLLMRCDRDIALTVYRRTPTLESKASLVSELMDIRFPKEPGKHDTELMKEFKSVIKDLKNRHTFRNDIAHGGLLETVLALRGKESDPNTSLFYSVVMPSQFKNNSTRLISIEEIRTQCREVFLLANRMRRLRESLQQALPG